MHGFRAESFHRSDFAHTLSDLPQLSVSLEQYVHVRRTGLNTLTFRSGWQRLLRPTLSIRTPSTGVPNTATSGHRRVLLRRSGSSSTSQKSKAVALKRLMSCSKPGFQLGSSVSTSALGGPGLRKTKECKTRRVARKGSKISITRLRPRGSSRTPRLPLRLRLVSFKQKEILGRL